MISKYPDVEINLSQCDGNVFSILGRCQQEARRQGVEKSEITLFLEEAQAGDYNGAIQTCLRWFNIT